MGSDMLSFSLLIESLQVVQSRKVFLLFKVVLLVFGLYVWSSSVEQDTIVAIIIPDKRTIFFIVISFNYFCLVNCFLLIFLTIV
ncbi:MAG: hypothetical protein A3G95_02430 [Flavobacteria bacterium RIFCSPLOWO2_12_FULL_31_7]|nr:MAG: hypothetical protein A3G95_02430 [Flavobacteria bacterium RIFCSPLOWO2_12_FULL_31_7]